MLVCLQTKVSILGSSLNVKCIERERQALLNFKQGLQDDFGMMSTWSNDKNNTDCCIWNGVECNNETGHIQKLDLRGNDEVYLTGAVNITSLIYLENILILDLSYNNLTSSIFEGDFSLSSKLQELRLQNCGLTDKNFLVPSSTSIENSSSSLVFIDLSQNLLKSSAIFHWILNFLTNLRCLYLDANLLEDPIPDEFGKRMKSLEILSLNSNKLQGDIPVSFGDICTLQELYLYNNSLTGEISNFIQNSSWCNRHVFKNLDLSHNRISGMLHNLSIFSSLRKLDLSNNQLTGEIPKSIGLLYELDELHLEENYFEGYVNELHLTNLSKLEDLYLSGNSLSVMFATTWIPTFQLIYLGLASCKLGPNFPSWLQTQSYLNSLDISDAEVDDYVPEWFWNKLQSISMMNISYNSLKGTIPNLPIKFLHDTFIVLKSNELEGGIPAFLSQAYTLDLFENKISDLNTFLCRRNATPNMNNLNLSNNQIMGQLSDCWDHLNSLQFLDLSNNNLSGKIPQSMGTLVNLRALILRNNNLAELPSTLKNCTYLDILDLSENMFSYPIPSWIGESLQQLRILSLRVNHFFGSVPFHLCYLRQIHLLDLSRNNLSGGIPTCLRNFTAMKKREVISERLYNGYALYDSNVLLMWKGQEHVYWNPENLLKSIDLSSNILTEFLDLSRNILSGKIPSALSKIDRLAVLDLSNNFLMGRIPWGRQLQTFDASSFEGKVDLCGEQLNKTCLGDKTTTKPQGVAIYEDGNSLFYGALYKSMGLGFVTGVWGLMGSILIWQPWRYAYLRFLNKVTDYIRVMLK
ncbi:LRR receptor-like serine/threonine-protein kinase FLS2 [Vigna unguiculata]|uniref:LRR receptor-like serine/threonine-protein kinase FLS2 n=1 Tax=Vigna unguiculata TaxID=3917 RepID=A0A4D6M1I3_VIGUN|nr:LRR receptor-like serine/threonine-protein kinase FLS2 [Vigna unguiculata]